MDSNGDIQSEVAQWEARVAHIHKVVGSNPTLVNIYQK